jgi:hypothetical protein
MRIFRPMELVSGVERQAVKTEESHLASRHPFLPRKPALKVGLASREVMAVWGHLKVYTKH